jgi:hypothetical protein
MTSHACSNARDDDCFLVDIMTHHGHPPTAQLQDDRHDD